MGLLVNILSRGSPRWLCLAILCAAALLPVPMGLGAEKPTEEPQIFRAAEVSITTDQQMDFGQLADKDGSVTLGLADSITADPNLIHFGGSPYSGVYTLTGDPDTMVDITVSSIPSNGFSIGSFVSSEGNLPLVGATLDGTGTLVLTIGATLTLDSSTAVVGNGQNISFTITATYN